VNCLNLAVFVLRPWQAMAKAPELGAGVWGAELGGLFFSGTNSEVPFSRVAFRPGRYSSRTPTRRDNSIAEMQRLIERSSQ